jgi:hypothetical protein
LKKEVMSCKKEGVLCKDLKVEQEDNKVEQADTGDELHRIHRERRDLVNQLVSCMEERSFTPTLDETRGRPLGRLNRTWCHAMQREKDLGGGGTHRWKAVQKTSVPLPEDRRSKPLCRLLANW